MPAALALLTVALFVMALVLVRVLDRLAVLEDATGTADERAARLEARMSGLERQSGRWIGEHPIRATPSPRGPPEDQPPY